MPTGVTGIPVVHLLISFSFSGGLQARRHVEKHSAAGPCQSAQGAWDTV